MLVILHCVVLSLSTVLLSGAALDRLPLSFEASSPGYVARGAGYAISLTGAAVNIHLRSETIQMRFSGGRNSNGMPENALPGKVNYLLGKNPKDWRIGVPTFERIRYARLYPGIDVVYYGNQQQLEFDLDVKPGAHPDAIRLQFAGVSKLSVDRKGDIVIGTGSGELRLRVPSVYQVVGGRRHSVKGSFKKLPSGEIVFSPGSFDPTRDLIIDPTLTSSTFLGGGTDATFPQAIAASSNNVYIAGYTYAADFSTASSAQPGYKGGADGFVSRLNSDGTALLYSTYLGGTGDDSLFGIAVDGTGAAWVVGYSDSIDFPTLSPYQSTLGGSFDVIVAKLSASGTLLFSSYLGGPSYDYGSSIALDPSGNAYLTGYTATGFPTTPNVVATANQGGTDAFVVKFSSSGSLVYSTYLGGAGTDYAYAIATDATGNAYVAGATFSNLGFHGAPSGGAQASYVNQGDAFIAKLNPTASAILYFTYLGGSQFDEATAIAVDAPGNAYVGGQTSSLDFPTTPGAFQTALNGGTNGFVAKLNPAGSVFTYQTYFGSNRTDSLHGLAVDANGNASLAGDTNGDLFPTANAIEPVFPGPSASSIYQTANAGNTWTSFESGLRGTAVSVSPDPSSSSTFVVSTDAGLFQTTNGGAAWTLKNAAGLVKLSRSPVSTNTIYGVNGSAVYKSTDGGGSWNSAGSLGQCCASAIVADPLNANTAYVFDNSGSFGILKTTNLGAAWRAITTGLPSLFIQSMVAASDGSLYVAVKSMGVYKSTNQGASWTPVSTGLPVGFSPTTVAVSASNASVVYAADSATLFKTTNGGGTWAPTAGSIPNSAILTIGVSPFDSQVVYASSPFSPVVYQSMDGGTTWNPAAAGLGNAFLYQFVFSPSTPGQVFVLGSVTTTAWLAKMNPTGTGIAYSTFLGGSKGTYQGVVATDGAGNAYVTGYTYSPDFPVSSSAFSSAYPGNGQGFVARVSDATATCSYTVTPGNQLISGAAQAVSYSVVAPSGCAWNAGSTQAWALIAGGVSGSGVGEVSVDVSANNGSATRSANLSIAGQTLTLNQASSLCSYTLNYNANVPGAGGLVPVQLTTTSGCDWRVTNNAPNAVSASPGSGTGSGVINLSVAANPSLLARTLTLTIGTSIVTLLEASQCTFTVSRPTPASASASALAVGVTTSTGCAWSASSNLPWAKPVAPAGGTGNGTATFNLAANPGPAPRSGSVTVAGQSVTIEQFSPFSTAPKSVTYDIDGDGNQDVIVYYPGSGGYVYSLLSDVSGGYASIATSGINPGGQPFDTVMQGDFNADTKSDVLLYSQATGILKVGIGDGTGHFTFAPTITISPGYNFIGRGDFNGDGKTDLLLYRQSDGAATVALSQGDGTFTFVGQIFSPGFTSVVIGDFNGDGISDVIVYNNQTSPFNAYLLPGDGSGHFASGTGLFFGGGFVVYPADINVDGKTDFILYRPTDGTVFVALSSGTSFTYHYLLYSSGFTAFKIADANGDGFPDLVLYNATNAIGYLLLGDGAGNFPTGTSLFFGPGMDYVDLRDANGDGRQDVLLYRTSDGTSFLGLSSNFPYGFAYTYSYFGPGRIVAQ